MKSAVICLSMCVIATMVTMPVLSKQIDNEVATQLHYYQPYQEINSEPGDVSMPNPLKNSMAVYSDNKLIQFIRSNVSPKTRLPYSFMIHESDKEGVYERMGHAQSVEGIIERTIVNQGLIVYDGAVAQMVLSLTGNAEDRQLAEVPVDIYWDGKVGRLSNIRAGYPINLFVYDPENPDKVSSDLKEEGKRGFVFRIINADGDYLVQDPLDGKTHFDGFPAYDRIHWEDWKPVAGENAWIVMAALQLYHQKYYDALSGRYEINEEAKELKLAREIARAAIILQANNGGVRMAPKGVYRNPEDFVDPDMPQGEWWYNQISSENNASWYGAFRMLYEITGDKEYEQAMKKIEEFYFSVWDQEKGYFHQGKHYAFSEWHNSMDHFALDVQTWGIASLGPDTIDQRLGAGTCYRIWQTAKRLSGVFDQQGHLQGVGYIEENNRLSVEWTAGAIIAARMLADYYESDSPEWAKQLRADADSMRRGVEGLRRGLDPQTEGYAYSSRRGWIPFGWNSHDPEVLSLASSGWMVFVDTGFNPFVLPGSAYMDNNIRIVFNTNIDD